MQSFLDFEAPVAELEGKIAELRALAANDTSMSIDEEVRALEKKAAKILADLYKDLTPWQKAQVARHPERPHTVDYIGALCADYTPLAGDRKFSEDFAIAGGLARFRGEPVVVIGQERGHDTASRVKHNFGMARPEGYRKAVRLMGMADSFGIPVISFIDTAGAYPGIDAEARGQAEAIARSTDCCLALGVPLLSLIIGEGGSGGAIAIATANAVVMMEHSIYSVISPEGAASILWRDPSKAKDAASAMKITAQDLKKLGIVDDIVAEPVGGAHRGREEAMASAGEALARQLEAFRGMPPEAIKAHRREKFLNIGRNL
jgi:acetyl-CoA carboxylase carboxyl transferase subunit alpha